ncbi:Plant cysteine oxidase 2 [Nymphaea thermarum]|nr:Plant cysteine oxidase 2 [Nymphaea thermarum]
MRIERNLISKTIDGLYDLPSRKKVSDKKGKKQRKKQKRAMLKKLHEACIGAFLGPGTIPPCHEIQQMSLILDDMKPSDLGLSEDMPYFTNPIPGLTPMVTMMPVFKCDNFSICIFCLPPSAVIPLHNHPGMTVFSKLLFGSMHVKSYDWVMEITASKGSPRLAKVHFDGVFTAECNTSILYPTTGGNMHCFRALEPCAILDVLGPPYSEADGRDCMYYRSLPLHPSRSGDDGRARGVVYELLEEIKKPDDFFFLGAEYTGPRPI